MPSLQYRAATCVNMRNILGYQKNIAYIQGQATHTYILKDYPIIVAYL
jgi:hypothetical protein